MYVARRLTLDLNGWRTATGAGGGGGCPVERAATEEMRNTEQAGDENWRLEGVDANGVTLSLTPCTQAPICEVILQLPSLREREPPGTSALWNLGRPWDLLWAGGCGGRNGVPFLDCIQEPTVRTSTCRGEGGHTGERGDPAAGQPSSSLLAGSQ